jgi:ppGpp synthetase/RelA/SpoT-type nucleotidyltranferase
MDGSTFDAAINYYKQEDTHLMREHFRRSVTDFFEFNYNLQKDRTIHSIKYRHKDAEHLRDKLIRKQEKGVIITPETLYENITDLIGVRVLHLYQQQFRLIHTEIMKKINEAGDWVLVEEPKAYTWEPENEDFYHDLGINTEVKETYYTSVHYVVKPNNNNKLSCEIQVRTLFEEIWGEIDHTINYPYPTESIACREQIRVLSRLVSTGTRLADSIFRTYQESADIHQKSVDIAKELSSI